ncbi:unnamed protein product [Vitrella brassicaformis CCMP3155]|uniref:Acid phosphatase n=2 Tax=Vitrella brassicaformis TaxID=1169539 RepID=A0A0G4FBA8_VITBC|nr:unnamed protein product [Vitrella brassicaformis CCMP3155]|mmetsp:Transcript_40400/g.101076  ORF Transcript_40400/g.101076 Transcript_40400/m.101076 type:complete len:514 (+) Transcript_40400:152-1693(+)|eukprot:CEM09920.1 unnamed protein product [Vitrella brassicaformis CCMP3155]
MLKTKRLLPILLSALVAVFVFARCGVATLRSISSSSAVGDSVAARQLVAVVAVCRHGARSPIDFFANDENTAATWPMGRGFLTPLGVRQMFLLGAALRHRYVDKHQLLSPSYTRQEVFVRSTAKLRTVQSASALMMGMFPAPQRVWQLNEDQASSHAALPPMLVGEERYDGPFDVSSVLDHLGDSALPFMQTAVPVLSLGLSSDHLLLGFEPNTCPPLSKVMDELLNDEEAKAANAKWLQEINEAHTRFDTRPDAFGLGALGDTLACEKADGRQLPVSEDSALYRAAIEAKDFGISHLNGHPTIAQIGATPFYSVLVDILSSKAQTGKMKISDAASPFLGTPELHEDTRFVLLSAHDSTISNLLGFIGLNDGKQPPFASLLAFELWREPSGEFTVSVLYNAAEKPVPGCSSDPCSLEAFQRIVDDKKVPGGYLPYCGKETSSAASGDAGRGIQAAPARRLGQPEETDDMESGDAHDELLQLHDGRRGRVAGMRSLEPWQDLAAEEGSPEMAGI